MVLYNGVVLHNGAALYYGIPLNNATVLKQQHNKNYAALTNDTFKEN